MSHSLYLLLPLLAIVLASIRARSRRSAAPLPPGPKPIPILGNLLQFPTKNAWLTYTEWGREYGDVVYINVLGKPIVILNSQKACVDLLDKRSAIYSDRPHSVMLVELMGTDWAFSVMPYSARWRQHRRLFHQFFDEKASRDHLGIQTRCVHSFLLRLLEGPSDFHDHIHLLFGEAVLDLVYDVKVKSHRDQRVRAAEEYMNAISQAIIPGRYLVDVLPLLKYLPSWFPGVGFHNHAAKGKVLGEVARELPAQDVLKSAELDEHSQSTVFSRVLQVAADGNATGSKETPIELAKNIGATTYIAGSETTIATTHTFFLAMANHPEIQRAAQLELDAVVGHDRIPTFQDSQDLPYVCAIVREVLRWHPALPNGVAHRVVQDDIYEGRLIPKGSIIIPNSWAILRDPEVYPDPDTFNPRRWLIETPNGIRLNEEIPYPDAAFGFGRRICPGQFFAQNGLFLTISAVLACFNISPLDASGKPCERLLELFTDGITSSPESYQVSITPRSERVLQLVKELST